MNDSMVTSPSPSAETRRRSHFAGFIELPQRRPIVLVLGMHRSGTSLCAHTLSAMGIDMADEIRAGSSNTKGHWERGEILEFHDRILSFFNRGYYSPFHDLPLPIAWWADPRVAEVRREIVEFLKTRMREGLFGFKDPRTVRMMPIWHQILKELRLAPKIVFCLRNPAQVARSLSARDGLDADVAEYRWFSYVADFFRYTNGYDICTLEYETWFDEPSTNLGKLLNFLELRWDQTELDLDLTISGIVDGALRHDDPNRREAGQPLVRSLYKLASRADREAVAREQIQLIVSQFISFQQFHRPLHRAFEDAATLAAMLPRIEQDAASLRGALSERDAMIDAANSKASSAEERLAASVAESEALRARIPGIERERDNLAGALDSARAVLASSQSSLAETSRRADELAAMLQATQAERAAAEEQSQAELGTLRRALAEAEQHGVTANAVAETMRAEIASLRDILARTAREASDRVAAGEATQGELRSLHSSLAAAERDAREHASTAMALQAEIVSLRSELAVARDVGGAALASLRSEAATVPEAPPSVGWLTLILRHFGLRARGPLPLAG
jgi:hypothetical protein